MNNLILPHLIPSPGQGWKRSSRLSGDLDRPADRRWLGPAARSCCSTSTAAQAQVHCELPNCNSPLRAPPTFPPACSSNPRELLLQVQCICSRERVILFHQITHLLHLHLTRISSSNFAFFTEHSGGLLQSITVWLSATVSQYTSANLEEAGIGIGLWAPVQISSSRETA